MRQGNDVGTQYRSAIYYTTPEQREIVRALARRLPAALAERHRGLITTEIAEAGPFYPAEEYHQQYLREEPGRLLRPRRHRRLLPHRGRRLRQPRELGP